MDTTDSTRGEPPAVPRHRWYQFGLLGLLVFTTLVTIVFPHLRLPILLFAWLILLLVLMAVGPKAGDGPKRRWTFACCQSLAAVYGPPFVASVNTWLFDGRNTWLHVDMWKFFLVAPGTINIDLAGVMVWHRVVGLSPVIEFVLSGVLSTMLLTISAWMAAKAGRARWGLLPLMAVWSSWGALFLDAGMRM